MKKRKNLGVQIMAFLALFGIVIGVVGTGVLYMFEGGTNNQNRELSEEELNELIKKIEESNSGTVVKTASGGLQIINSTGSTNSSTGSNLETSSGTSPQESESGSGSEL